MRDRGAFASGRKLDVAPNLFLGATANPFVPPFRDRIANLERKIDAGAQFIQTQFCFDVPMLADFMARGARARTAQALRHHRRRRHAQQRQGAAPHGPARARRAHSGIRLARIAGADNQKAEAKAVLVETIKAVSEIGGVAGVHLMGYRNDDILAEAIEQSGIRRGVSTRAA